MEDLMTVRLVVAASLCLVVANRTATDGGKPGGIARDFPGTGGPGGSFDWRIGDDLGGARRTVILDTTYSVIENAEGTAVQTVMNGQVDVRNLSIRPNGVLVISGPNPCVIAATGEIHIDGVILARGGSNPGVVTLDTTNIPEPGAPGAPGGGRGGTGSFRTTSSTEAGGNGFGAFDSIGRGGAGGESAYNPLGPASGDDARRPAGGGGGTFGHDFLRPAGIVPGYTNQNFCPDQQVIGYDAEHGFRGYGGPAGDGVNGAIGVISGSSPPRGGAPGPRPFTDDDRRNDFWGTMYTTSGQMIHGELQHPWAGSGGGAGGDAIVSSSFPTMPFDPAGDEKGAGGGGGGGSLTLFAVGPIVFGQAGRIDASGGTGGGGENSSSGGITHIGGGSGGGSGGHVILESSARIDFSRCRTTSNPPGGIYALGGQGGAGKDNVGGSTPGGHPTLPLGDALPQNSYPISNAPCAVNGSSGQNPGYPPGFVNNVDPDGPLVVICAGGDGGPGIIQLHVSSPDGIVPPASPGENVYKMIKPPPVASLPASGVPSYDRINRPASWNQMLPQFGLRSQASSMWTPLATGSLVRASTVIELPSILAVRSAAARPFIAADRRTIVIDASTIVDDVYLRYPSLLRSSEVRITRGSATTAVAITDVFHDAETGELRLSVSTGEAPLAPLGSGDALELRPAATLARARHRSSISTPPVGCSRGCALKAEFR
jgi:hypothetical protein